MGRTIAHLALILLVSVPVMFANLGVPKLWDRDEPRNAGCAEEMMRRGDLVVPMFDDELRTAKPVLTYWLIISAYEVFGVNEFAARFWSAMLAVGTVLATYVIGRRLFEPRVGLWGAIILATSTMFCVAGRAATPDSPLIFCTTFALMIYVVGAFRRDPATASAAIAHEDESVQTDWFPRNWWLVAALYAVMGLGILAKGPVGLVLPTAVIGMFLLIMRLPIQQSQEVTAKTSPVGEASRLARAMTFLKSTLVQSCRVFAPLHFLRTCWYMRPLTAIAAALAVAAPWFILVGLRTEGDFLDGFFLTEHFGRATQAFENHRGSVLYYPVAILICFFPWSVFAGPTLLDTIARLRQDHPWRPGIIFLVCWVGVYVGVFSLAQTKLPSYVTPCYPALALLTAGFVYQWLRGAQLAGDWPRAALVVLGAVGLGILIGLPIAALVLLPGEEWLGAVGLIPLAGAIAALVFCQRQQYGKLGVTLAVTSTVYVLAVFGVALVRIDRHQQNHRLLEAIANHSSNPSLASFGCLESSWIFYAKRPIVQLQEVVPGEKSPAAVAAVPQREKPWLPLPKTDVRTFFARHEEAFLITTEAHLRELQAALPADVEVLAEAGYFLKDKKLVVLGRTRASRNASAAAPGSRLR